jgi:2-haloacid dehalogenase
VAALTGHRWVTFDCYGTLIDWQAGFTAALMRLASDRAPALVRAYHARERDVERERPLRSYKDVLTTALVRAAADVGVPLSAADARILWQSWGTLRTFADVEPLLADLRRRGWRLAVLTNCDDDLFEITHRTFRTPFDLFLPAERVRGYKPAPWHFRAFELMTRVDRRDWVHVASSWYHDIAPARALGVTRVWLDREHTGENPAGASVHVHTAAGVLEAIDRLVA